MRNPRGIRTDSNRTPKASRAGALYLYLYSTLRNSKTLVTHAYNLNVGAALVCRQALLEAGCMR